MPCKHCHPEKGEPKKKRMSASACKAKGRRLQQRVRDDLIAVGAGRIDPTDVVSTPMGCNGVDVQLSKAARDFFGDLAIEAKNVEVLNAIGVFQKHLDKYQPQGKIPLMVHARNHIEPRVTLLWSTFITDYLAPALEYKRLQKNLQPPKREVADGECPECGHGWTRHTERFGGHCCAAKRIDASGNWEQCGCNVVPPKK